MLALRRGQRFASDGRQENSFSEFPWSGQKLPRNHLPQQQLRRRDVWEEGGVWRRKRLKKIKTSTDAALDFFFFSAYCVQVPTRVLPRRY